MPIYNIIMIGPKPVATKAIRFIPPSITINTNSEIITDVLYSNKLLDNAAI